MQDPHTHINLRQEGVYVCVCLPVCECASLCVCAYVYTQMCVRFHSPVILFKTPHYSKLHLLEVCAPFLIVFIHACLRVAGWE